MDSETVIVGRSTLRLSNVGVVGVSEWSTPPVEDGDRSQAVAEARLKRARSEGAAFDFSSPLPHSRFARVIHAWELQGQWKAMDKKTPGKQISTERLAKFLEAYIACGYNGMEAGIRIGMSRKSAKANAHKYVRAIRNRLDFKGALTALGLTPAVQLAKLKRLEKIKIPKWNPSTESWDIFEAGSVQLEATKEINKIMGAYPAEKLAVEPMTVNLVFSEEP